MSPFVHCDVCDEPVKTFIQVWTQSTERSTCLCDDCIGKIATLAAQDRGGHFEAGPSIVRRLWRKKQAA